MHGIESQTLHLVSCKTRVKIPYVISCVCEISSCSHVFAGIFVSACAVTRLLIHLGFLEGSRKAAPAQNTRGTGRARNKFSERKKVFSPDRPYALVIFVSATVRPRPSEPKSISTRETSQAAKNKHVENNQRTRILTRKKTKSHKGFAHASCTRQDEESFFLSHVLLPI